ncbi:MAG TPA: hypothetical protein VKW76_16015 [Candidatus Binatia bacterium]|nr:hypothetical protein [Candidatus Binatia bacterium]
MALEGLSEQEIAAKEEQLLTRVPNSEAIGNVTLRGQLSAVGWDEETYWAIRNRLIERGVLETGRGKGGSVRRVVVAAPPPQVPAAPATSVASAAVPEATSERDLYAPMLEVIRSRWAQDYRLDSHIAEITAQQGARPTGGRWTRPDITLASYKTFAYVPGKHFDLITFEIKPFDSLDVTVVYEALAHRRAATRSYALVHIPDHKQAELRAVLDEVTSEAKRFGVGLLVASNPADYDTWEELVESVRHEPDPERLNDFLAQQVSQGFREQVVRWFR